MQRITASLLHRRVALRRQRVLGISLLCGGLALATTGCRPAQPPPAVATGERPVTGVARYDRFFADVSATRAAVDEARSEESDAQNTLARRVGLPEATSIDVVGARLRERTARWASEGLTLELELTGIGDAELTDAPEPDEAGAEPAEASTVPSATLRTPGREPAPRELRLLEALAQAALSGVSVYANMSHERRQVERLELELGELQSQLATSFAVSSERARVGAKLDEAAGFLPELKARCREVSGSSDVLLSVLEEAANTVPVTPGRRRPGAPAAKPVAAEPRVPTPPGRPAPAGASKGSPVAAPPPAPPPAP